MFCQSFFLGGRGKGLGFLHNFTGFIERQVSYFLGNFTPKTSNPVALKIGVSLAFQVAMMPMTAGLFQHTQAPAGSF